MSDHEYPTNTPEAAFQVLLPDGWHRIERGGFRLLRDSRYEVAPSLVELRFKGVTSRARLESVQAVRFDGRGPQVAQDEREAG